MSFPTLTKDRIATALRCSVTTRATYASFTWDAARRDLDGLPDGGLNIAHEAVDRHANGERRDRVALRFLGSGPAEEPVVDVELTYAGLADLSGRFAAVLASLGVEPGERVFSLMGRRPELYAAILGSFKHRAVFCPLFSAFGPEPVKQRLQLGDGVVLVTTPDALPTQGGACPRPASPPAAHPPRRARSGARHRSDST